MLYTALRLYVTISLADQTKQLLGELPPSVLAIVADWLQTQVKRDSCEEDVYMITLLQ